MTKKEQSEQQEARETLRKMLPPGTTVYCNLRSVSRSGMNRKISFYVIEDGKLRWISWLVAKATGYGYNRDHEALNVSGCGMDMGFAVVSHLSAELYPDGFGCIGEECRSNDHSNGDRNRTAHSEPAPHWHRSGDYALQHEWI